MHIPDGFLTAGVTGVTWAVAGIGVAAALRAEKADPQPMPAGMLGATAAFVFAAQMINIPVAPGTSGHLVGAALVGGAAGPLAGGHRHGRRARGPGAAVPGRRHHGARREHRWTWAWPRRSRVTPSLRCRPAGAPASAQGRVGGVLGAFAATLVAAVLTACGWGCPASILVPVVQLMLVTHVAIGLLEAALTGAVLATVARWRPDLLRGAGRRHVGGEASPWPGGVFGVALAIAAFLSPFASALPDGLDHAAERLGFAGRAAAAWPAPFPDYAVPFLSSPAAATAAAGVAGTIRRRLVAWGVSRGVRQPGHDAHR